MSGERRDRDRRPARRLPSREPRRRLLVVCEGERTKPEYLKGVRAMVRNPAVDVQFHPQRGKPRKVVEMAKEAREIAAERAKAEKDPFLADDEVWGVFDRDDHERFFDAIQMAKANGLKLAVSNPCFELWLLLHFRESPGSRHRQEQPQLLRKRHLPNYDKRIDFHLLAAGVKDAIARAERLAQIAEYLGEDLYMNPTTGVYHLVRAIGCE